MVFRRRKGSPNDVVDDVVDDVDDALVADGDLEAGDDVRRARPRAAAQSTSGPYDSADVPDDEIPRVDLGGVRIPVPDGVELRVEVDQQTGLIASALVVHGDSVLQVGAYAAPRTEGIWAEVREEIAAGLREAGGRAEPSPGPFGTELRGSVPVEAPGQGRQTQPARFIGVDGPRWFLRGLMQGPAAAEGGDSRLFESIFRGIVVVRGSEAMAPRDALPLRMPAEFEEQMAAQIGAEVEPEPEGSSTPYTSDALDPYARGPEITETR
jgi:uncharacterized protein DUF3710